MTSITCVPITDTAFKAGDRVFYVDEGAEDTGAVVEVVIYSVPTHPREEVAYRIQWDAGSPSADEYDDIFTAGQLERIAV